MNNIAMKKIELSDQEQLAHYFGLNEVRSCEYTFANLYLWSRRYPISFAIVSEMLVFYYTEMNCFIFPMGDYCHLTDTIEQMMAWAEAEGVQFRMLSVTREQFAELEKRFPGKFEMAEYREGADYVYETEKLIRLSGKKYHGKKNHVNKFMKTWPDWSYEPITKKNVEECFQMALQWRSANGCDDDHEKNCEMCVCLNALRLFEELKLRGGLIRAGGKVVAFSIGEPACKDTMVVHIEKAFADVQGAYAIINQQFLAHEAADYLYVNREEDDGEPGLRQAKESYHPIFMVEKGIVVYKGEDTSLPEE